MSVERDVTRREAEALLLSVLLRFESRAVSRYASLLPELAPPEHGAFVAELERHVGAAAVGAAPTALRGPVDALLEATRRQGPLALVIGQGLILELLGRAVYEALASSPDVSPVGGGLARRGVQACDAVLARLPGAFEGRLGAGDPSDAFVTHSGPALRLLDPLGLALDATVGPPLGIASADLVADFTAALIPACAGLGLERRRVVGHLTACLMGV